jgi:hypothetical protein
MNDVVVALCRRAESWHGMDLAPERLGLVERMMEGHVLSDWLVLARRGPDAPNLCAWATLDEMWLMFAWFALTGRNEPVAFALEKVALSSVCGAELRAGPLHLRCALQLSGLRAGRSHELVISSEHAYDPPEATLAVQAFVQNLDRVLFPRRR